MRFIICRTKFLDLASVSSLLSLLKFGKFSTAPEDLVDASDPLITKFFEARQSGLPPGGGISELYKGFDETPSTEFIYLEKLFITSVRINLSLTKGTIDMVSTVFLFL